MSDSVPLIDLADWDRDDPPRRAAVVAQVDRALREIGFLLVVGHRMPEGLTDSLRGSALEFFHLPTEAKERYAGVVGGRGWVPPGKESNAGADGLLTPPDLKEGFRSGPAAVPEGVVGTADAAWYSPNVWPAEVPSLQAQMNAFAVASTALVDELLEICAVALDLPVDFFTSRCDINPYTVALNWYPPAQEVGQAAQGQLRIGQHTDFGTLTVLDREAGFGGLQVRTLAGEWIDAPFVPGALTINTGDLLARWSGDRWRSTPHRVLPPPPEAPAEELLSLVFFHGANNDTLIETLETGSAGPSRYEPVLAADFLRRRLDSVTVA